jgi:N-acetylglucosamine-6-phosphate deacetylase
MPSSLGLRAIIADRVFDGTRFREQAAVLIDGRHIRGLAAAAEVPAEAAQVRLPEGAVLAPGFIDLQVNGGGGVLFNDQPTADGLRAIAAAHRRFGTTGCLPTLITDTREKIATALAAAQAPLPGVLGLHLEGPFLNPARKGVHRPDLIVEAQPADLDLLRGLRGHSMVTLAPERVPAGFVRALAAAGIRIAAGHSEASAAEMARAVDEGLTGVTHLFNAMPPWAGRAPGIVGAAFAEPRLTAGIIVDGLHVDPMSVRAAFAAKPDGIALVTDAMPTVGSDIDAFDLMGRRVALADGRLTIADGTLGGAHLDMASAVRNAVQMAGLRLDETLRAAALTPARFLGIAHERGALTAGAYADMVALSPGVEVIATWIEGEAAFN